MVAAQLPGLSGNVTNPFKGKLPGAKVRIRGQADPAVAAIVVAPVGQIKTALRRKPWSWPYGPVSNIAGIRHKELAGKKNL